MTPATGRRPDFSEGLIHLTKERDDVKPFEVLKEILQTGILKASGHKGFIKGKQKAVCLSEIPLSAVPFFASRLEVTEKARYRFYGLALSKKAVFEAGGRPVIYLPDNEADWIPEDQKWRHVRFEHPRIDWTHEREWRVLGDLDLSTFPGIYILVWTATEAREIQTMNFSLKKKIRGFLAMEHLSQFL